MYLKRICINNLLSFKRAEFSLGAYTVIAGPNNSGKTNLLRILEMISKNENLEYLQLNRRNKFDPDKSSEITLTLELDESEIEMVFQGIFGMNYQVNTIPKDVKTLNIIIFWGNDQLEMIHPKFTLYEFGNGFTIATHQSGENIAYDTRSIPGNRADYEKQIDSWRTSEQSKIFDPLIERIAPLRYDKIGDKKRLMDVILSGGRLNPVVRCGAIIALPMSIKYNPNATTSIVRLVKGRRYADQFTAVSVGLILNRIFEEGFTLVKEIHPTYKDLSNKLAEMRNSHHAEYSNLLDTFKEISGGIEVLVERDGNDAEQILFVENGRRYDIGESASGYYALISILYLLLGKTSGLVAIDEPEIHFHPMMITRLHEKLRSMSLQKDNQIIIITHSPKFVTYEQAKQEKDTRLVMMTRPETTTVIHANLDLSPLKIKPHLFNSDIFFGRCTMMVEGPSDFFTMKAISDFHGGLFEKCGVVLMHCNGKGNLPAFADLHEKFQIQYHGMADNDYDGELQNITKLSSDLEGELENMGVRRGLSKAKDDVYVEVTDFLNSVVDKKWKQTGIGDAFVKTINKARGTVPD